MTVPSRGDDPPIPPAPPGGGKIGEVFEYAVLRVIPRVDRGEAMNAGVLLYCRPLRYLGARIALDAGLLLALDPAADVPGVERALAAAAAVCDGTGQDAGAGRPGGHRPPVPLADRAAQHGGPGGPGAHRADPRSGDGDRPAASGTRAATSVSCDRSKRAEALRANQTMSTWRGEALQCGRRENTQRSRWRSWAADL